MSEYFGVVVLNGSGEVIAASVPSEIPQQVLGEAIALARDVYRVVSVVSRELGYKMPRSMTLRTLDYEVTVFNRHDKLIVAVIFEDKSTDSYVKQRELAVAES